MRAVWRGVTLAESDQTVVLEGNHYFSPESVRWEHLAPARRRSVCPWKGMARYYAAEADGERAAHAAWSYPQPFPWIRKIAGHVAFSGEVEVRP